MTSTIAQKPTFTKIFIILEQFSIIFILILNIFRIFASKSKR